jgi:hypothetical protein
MDSITDMNFNPIYIHPEEEPIVDELNLNITQIDTDLKYIDDTLTMVASNYNSLMESTKLKLNNIKELLNTEKERQEDINILCNKYSDFSSVITLGEPNFEAGLTFTDGILTANVNSTTPLTYTVKDISGNGQAGNTYVYQNEEFISDVLDTSNTSYIGDGNLTTSYEYERLTINNSETAPLSFNKDSIEAKCSIVLSSSDYINKVLVNSDRTDLILKEVYISDDGSSFTLDRTYNIQINKNQEKYNDQSYIYGSGIISVKPSKYVKLCFKSNGYTDDTIAYIKAFSDTTTVTKKIVQVASAKRHVIKLNGITLSKNVYGKGTAVSKELITDPVKYIGLYCNEYISSDYDIENTVKYYLIINGTEHEITPVNSQRNGKKIIRTSSQTYQLDNTIYIEESIKSAKLKIVISSSTSITPYISNLKLLVGGYN